MKRCCQCPRFILGETGVEPTQRDALSSKDLGELALEPRDSVSLFRNEWPLEIGIPYAFQDLDASLNQPLLLARKELAGGNFPARG
jgi:hypothetical protein